jgi:membrane protein DedA with SNARE-associated domain
MDHAVDALVTYGYVIVFGSVLAEQLGLPIPAIPFLLAAGGLVASHHLNLGLSLGLAGIASLAADTSWYWVGRLRGARVLGWMCRISLEPDSCVLRTETIFAKYGARSLLVAKFIPGFSTVAPPLSGVVRMPMPQFLVLTGLGGVIWAGVFMSVGWVFSRQLTLTAEYAAHFGKWTVVLVTTAIGGYVVSKYVTRQRFLRKLRIARITPEELRARLQRGEDVLVVDVRQRIDFELEPFVIPGALHLTTNELDARSAEIPRGREIVLYCT